MRIQNIRSVGEGLGLLQLNGLRGISWALLCTLPLLALRDVASAQMGGPEGSPYLVLGLRFVLIFMSVMVLVAPRFWPALLRRPTLLAATFFPLIVLMVDLTIARTGGAHSPVFAGLLTVMVGWAYFVPLAPSIAALLFLLVILSYGVTVGAIADVTILGQITVAYQLGLLVVGGTVAWLANNVYRSDEIARFRALIEQRRLSRLDALTGCANRRALNERTERACRRAQRFNQYLACLVVDIDDFKRVNDTHGHAIGDNVLKHLGGVLIKVVGVKGLVARWGGEEFVVLLPGQNEERAAAVAEQMREMVDSSPVDLPSGPVSYTISVGVHSSPGEDCTSMAGLLDPADEALYRAKEEGKNQVFPASRLQPRVEGVTSQFRIRTAAPAEEKFGQLASSDFAQKWLKEMGHQALVRFSVVVCVLTAVLEPLDALWRLGKGWDPFSIEILLLRALIIAVVGGSALISHKFSFVRRRVFWLHLLLPLFSALGFSLLSYTTGAEEGSTFIGMMFLLVVVSFTTPGGLRMGIPLVVLLTCAWPLTILTVKSISGESVDMVALMVRTSIIVTMGIVCLFLQGLFHRIRFEQASVQAHLEHTSNTDRLTGAANRRVFHARLQEEVASALRERAPLALVLFDLDHLKNINDSHGHLAGDAVLSKLSQAVLGEVRSIDVFARLGGDEFALILPGTHAEGARTLTSRIRKNLASAVVEVRRKTPVEISASMGIAVLDGEEGQPDELGKTLFDHADRAVYEVKQKGRGGVAIWSGEGPEMIQVES